MGNKQSQTLENYVRNTSEYKQVIKSVVKTETNTNASATSINNINITNGKTGVIECPEFNLTQTINSKVNIINKNSLNFKSELIADLQKEASAQFDEAMTQIRKNDLIPEFAGKTQNDVKNEIINEIGVTLENELSLQQISNLTVVKFDQNDINLVNKGVIRGVACNINQNIELNMMIENTIEQITDAIINNKVLEEYYTDITAKMHQEQKGVIGNLTDTLGDILTSPFFLIAAAVGCCLCVILIVVIFSSIGGAAKSSGSGGSSNSAGMMAFAKKHPKILIASKVAEQFSK